MSSPVLFQRRPEFTEDTGNDSSSSAPTDLASHLSHSASASVITTMTNAKPRLKSSDQICTTAVAAAAAAAAAMSTTPMVDTAATSDTAANERQDGSESSRQAIATEESQVTRGTKPFLFSDTDVDEHDDASDDEDNNRNDDTDHGDNDDDDDEDDDDDAEERQTIASERTIVDPSRAQRVWEADQQASECRRCGRRFNFLVRRHHCRRCGQVVCDRCSTHRLRLPVDEIIQDPMTDPSHYAFIAMHPQRVCTACIRPIAKRATSPPPLRSSSSTSSNPYSRGSGGMNMRRSDSTQSLMTECPVCGTGFLGTRKTEQERHLRTCLNKGSPPVQPIRYVVYELSRDSVQINDECPICFEDFAAVAICWGSTNPLIKAGSAGLERVSAKYPEGGLKRWFAELKYLFTRWQYVLPLLLNLSGSVVYYYTLGQSDMSLAVPITNSLTFVFSLLTGLLLGEPLGGKDAWLGMALVILGVAICLTDDEFRAKLEAHFALYRLNLRSPLVMHVTPGYWYRVDLLLVNELGLFRRADIEPNGVVQVACKLLETTTPVQTDNNWKIECRATEEGTEADKAVAGFQRSGRGAFEYRITSKTSHAAKRGPRYLHIYVDRTHEFPHDPKNILPLIVGPVFIQPEQTPVYARTNAPIADWPENTPMVHDGYRLFSNIMIHESWDAGIPGKIWDSALVMLGFVNRLAETRPEELQARKVVDLSAGTGLLGLALADKSKVIITELDEALALINQNVAFNGYSDMVQIQPLLWGDAKQAADCGKADVILASDVLYEAEFFEDLVKTFVDLSDTQTKIYIGYKRRGFEAEEERRFWSLCKVHFDIVLLNERSSDEDPDVALIPSLATAAATTAGYPSNVSLPLNLTCPPLTPRTQMPKSVYDLRPDDIKVVMGIGDSVMAGFGAKGLQGRQYVSKSTLREDRGVSFAMGGDTGAVTLPNMIHYYSPYLYGASKGSHLFTLCFAVNFAVFLFLQGDSFCPVYQYRSSADVLNAAQSGARSMNLDHELDYVLKQLEEAYKTGDVKKTDWKMLIVFIGSNDMCHACTLPSSLPPAYAVDLLAAIDRVRVNVPNVLVQIENADRLIKKTVAGHRNRVYPSTMLTLGSPPATLDKSVCTRVHGSITVPCSRVLEPVNAYFLRHAQRVMRKNDQWEDEPPEKHRKSKVADDKSSEADFEETPRETPALLALDPSDWKQHDLYAILGLANLRYTATPEQIKRAHKRKVLKHHPDKKVSQGGIDDDSFFKCISKAYECLSDPSKRRLYDSVDYGIPDPQVPKLKKTDDFFTVFRPIFELEARFSNKSNVPVLGDLDSSEEDVMRFYDFWYNFDSWRTFDHLDKDEDEGETREDKRFIERKNRAERARRRKEYLTRLRNIVDQAHKSDPRIQQFKEAKKRAKDEKRREKEKAQKIAELEKEKVTLEKNNMFFMSGTNDKERRLAEQKEEEEVKSKQAAEEKKQKEKYKKLLKKERKNIKASMEDSVLSMTDKERESQIAKLEMILDSMNLEEMQIWKEELKQNKSSIDEKAKKLMIKEKALELQPKKVETAPAKEEKHQHRPWHAQEISLLIKAMKKYPVGTVSRWQVVAEYVSHHSGYPIRSEAELTRRVSELKKGSTALAEHEKSELQHLKKHNDDKHLVEQPTINYDGKGEKGIAAARPWTSEEQRMLEKALQKYPPKWTGEGDRWDHIQNMVVGRTKKECKLRVKTLAEQIRASKTK
ncbi:DnaJ (Hsp40), sub C, member 2 [Apophysomyces ossiformis]|uniref:DnaJ (Hsp40), sub C, member 2 n=1 Tax=Apophysomyces ossiformis TaxID=679940 RepID=A0A8H7ERL2_9FUNG|nr:DnaJ (Hsp40), sub C, member 2 [Apophysomyces ossiformis]